MLHYKLGKDWPSRSWEDVLKAKGDLSESGDLKLLQYTVMEK